MPLRKLLPTNFILPSPAMIHVHLHAFTLTSFPSMLWSDFFHRHTRITHLMMCVFLPSRTSSRASTLYFRACQTAIFLISPQVKQVSCIFLSGHRSISIDICARKTCPKRLYLLDIGQYMQNLRDPICISGAANALV